MARSSVPSLGSRVVKQLLVGVNAFVLVCSLILIIVASVAVATDTRLNGFAVAWVAGLIVVLAVILALCTLLGLHGAVRDNKQTLSVFLCIVVILTAIEFAVGIIAFVNRNELPAIADSSWSVIVAADPMAIEAIEDAYKCCGWRNTSDRAVPPYGNETVCSSLHPGWGACADTMIHLLEFVAVEKQNEYGRQVLRSFQTDYNCCGWYTVADDLFLPFFIQNYTLCPSYLGAVPPCRERLTNFWYDAGMRHDDLAIAAEQDKYNCCGWNTTVDYAVPPYYNDTCFVVKGYDKSCQQDVTETLSYTLHVAGGGAIAMAVLQFITLALAITLMAMSGPSVRADVHELSEPIDLDPVAPGAAPTSTNTHQRFQDED